MSDKINVLSITERLIPSSILSIIKPMLRLQGDGVLNYRMKFSFQYKEVDIQWADVVVLCRNIRSESLEIIELVQKYHKKMIYDIDDNFFELSVATPLGKYHRYPLHLFTITQLIKHSDVVRVYSKPMEEISGAINSSTFKLKSYFDFSLIDGIVPQKHDKIRIVYATSRGNSDTLSQICLPAVAAVMTKYPDLVEFYTFGKIPALLKGKKSVHKLAYIHDYSKFIRFFMKMGFDIGLAPLHDDRFCNSKTNNKFREYGAMRVCGIYSNAEIYRECVENRHNGLIVNNSVNEWYDAICELIENPDLRESIKENAQSSVKEFYSMENTIADWKKLLKYPVKEHPKFNNFLNLKIALLYDGKCQWNNYRINELTRLLGVCKIRYKVFDFNYVDLCKVVNYDIHICFISKAKDVKAWVMTMKNFGIKDIVIDTLLPFAQTSDFSDILFTNPEAPSANSFCIPDLYSYSSINPGEMALRALATFRTEMTFSDIFGCGISQITENEEMVFSVKSPMFLWAEFLSRYDTAYPKAKHKFVVKILIKSALDFSTLVMKISNVLFKIWNNTGGHVVRKLTGLFNKIGWCASCWRDYIKINIFKKY